MSYTTSAVGDGITDDTTAIQADVNARRTVILPPRTYKITAPITLPAGTRIQGASKWATTIIRPGSDQSYFVLGDGCALDELGTNQPGFNSLGLRVNSANGGTNATPTTGTVVNVSGQFCRLSNVRICAAFDAIACANWHLQMDQIDLRAYERRGLSLTGGDHFIGNFKFWQGGPSISNEADASDGVGIYLYDHMEAFAAEKGDVMGGLYGLLTAASSYTVYNRPAHNRFTSVYFDSASGGSVINNAVGFDFVGGWFCNRWGNGLTLQQCSDIKLVGGSAADCSAHGVQITSAAKRVVITGGFSASGNNTNDSGASGGNCDGIRVDAGTTDFNITNCVLGDAVFGYNGSQVYGVRVMSGASDRYIIADNLVSSGNASGGVYDGGSGSNKRVANNY